jgi:hypothetical protein
MKRGAAAIGTFTMVLSACDSYDYCVHRDTKYYDEALSRQLTKNDVKHSVAPDKGVCVADKQEIDKAAGQVETYFHEVATLAADSCEEGALVAWATREGLRFDVLDTTSSTGKRGRMFLIRSFSSGEADVNHKKLREFAPSIRKCPKAT